MVSPYFFSIIYIVQNVTKFKSAIIASTLATTMLLFAPSAWALNIIRDTQIEAVLNKWAQPILKQAGLEPRQVNIVLVNSPNVNAFVAGGANIFIYAGLIDKADYPEEIQGVIAHEIGHITGGHLISLKSASRKASFQSILTSALGIGAAILTGDGRAASAIVAGGSASAQAGFLKHSRTHESAADQAAFKYLNNADINPHGFLSFLEKLQEDEFLPASQQAEYMRTHPLTRDRIETAQFLNKKANTDQVDALGQSSHQIDFDLIKAKLKAFNTPSQIIGYYNIDSGGIIPTFAYAIMHYRQNDTDRAITLIDQVIDMAQKQSDPNYPYFIEIKAQILRDAGRLPQAQSNYHHVLTLLKGQDIPLIKTNLAHVMLQQNISSTDIENLLSQAIQSPKRDNRAYRLMATYKGRKGLEADAQYYLAEEAIAHNNKKLARKFINHATHDDTLSPNLVIKANDLKTYIDSLPNKGK